MPGGQGGGGGWARLTAGETSSISGRIANTTADKALCCSQAFIAHLLSVAFCVGILRFAHGPGARFSAYVAGSIAVGTTRSRVSAVRVQRLRFPNQAS